MGFVVSPVFDFVPQWWTSRCLGWLIPAATESLADGAGCWRVDPIVAFDTAAGLTYPCFQLVPRDVVPWDEEKIEALAQALSASHQPPARPRPETLFLDASYAPRSPTAREVSGLPPDFLAGTHLVKAWQVFRTARAEEAAHWAPERWPPRSLVEMLGVTPWALFVPEVVAAIRQYQPSLEGDDLQVALSVATTARRGKGRPRAEPSPTLARSFLATCDQLVARGRTLDPGALFQFLFPSQGDMKHERMEVRRTETRAAAMVLEPLLVPAGRACPLPDFGALPSPKVARFWALTSPFRLQTAQTPLDFRVAARAWQVPPEHVARDYDEALGNRVKAFVADLLAAWAAEPAMPDRLRVLTGGGRKKFLQSHDATAMAIPS